MKSVGIAELKSHLSRYIHTVRSGRTIIVLDRKLPVARVVPFFPEQTRLRIQSATRPLRDVIFPPPSPDGTDSTNALLEERRDKR